MLEEFSDQDYRYKQEIERLNKLVNHQIEFKGGSDRAWSEKYAALKSKLKVARKALEKIRRNAYPMGITEYMAEKALKQIGEE